MTKQHPLTDDIIWSMWSESDRSALAEEKLARAAADWQLEQVVKWIWANLNDEYADGFVEQNGELCCYLITDSVVDDLLTAMRP